MRGNYKSDEERFAPHICNFPRCCDLPPIIIPLMHRLRWAAMISLELKADGGNCIPCSSIAALHSDRYQYFSLAKL